MAGEFSCFLGVIFSDGSVMGEGEEAVLPAVVCVTDCDEVDRTSAVEDIVASSPGWSLCCDVSTVVQVVGGRSVHRRWCRVLKRETMVARA